jgi:hypothetical protein
MTLPGLLLAFLLATAGGLAFHLIRGGSIVRMAVYVVTAWVTFFAGHALAQVFGWTFGRLGSINLVAATAATVLSLLAVSVLARPEGKPRQQARKPPSSEPPG